MELIYKYGLSDFFISQINKNEIDIVARIISANKKNLKAITKYGEKKALIKGSSIHYNTLFDSTLPKVGDFVVLETQDYMLLNDSYFIKKVLNRSTTLKRKIIGNSYQDQILATNIDYAFVCISADMQFSLAKMQRIITACIDSKIIPVILLTKIDICENYKDLLKQIKLNFSDFESYGVSIFDSKSINIIQEFLKNNKTGVLIGSSGCGKSSITNILLEDNIQKTQDVSVLNNKGRHTTTARTIFLLPQGGCIIDTPGIKEFALWVDNDNSIDNSFFDITSIAKMCKFSNCTHTTEIACKVKEALLLGEISQDRLNEYLKLKNENLSLKLHKKSYHKQVQQKNLSKKVKIAKLNKAYNKDIN